MRFSLGGVLLSGLTPLDGFVFISNYQAIRPEPEEAEVKRFLFAFCSNAALRCYNPALYKLYIICSNNYAQFPPDTNREKPNLGRRETDKTNLTEAHVSTLKIYL
jgi:hypothetical protein